MNCISADMYEKNEVLKLTKELVKRSELEFKFVSEVKESTVDWKLTTYFTRS